MPHVMIVLGVGSCLVKIYHPFSPRSFKFVHRIIQIHRLKYNTNEKKCQAPNTAGATCFTADRPVPFRFQSAGGLGQTVPVTVSTTVPGTILQTPVIGSCV